MTRVIFILPVLVFAAVVIAFAGGLKRDPSQIPSALIDRPLPQFDLPGVSPTSAGFATAEFRGEPKLLNVFASWCGACRQEHPFLMGLKDQGVLIYGLDWKDKPADGAAWLVEFGNPYTKTANDESGRTGIDLGVTGAPETFVIDRRGRVRYKQIGPINAEVWDGTIKPLMDKLRLES